MWPFRRPKNIEIPFTELIDPSAQINNRAEVVETIESLQISRDRLIIVGSSVLALLGLPRRAGDLDIALHPDTLEELNESGELPSGLPVTQAVSSWPGRLHFKADTQPLPTELFSHKSSAFHETFERVSEKQTILLGDIEGLAIDSDTPRDLRIIRPSAFETRLDSDLHQSIYFGSPENRRREYLQDVYDQEQIRAFRERQP